MELHYEIIGEGFPVIFLHGLSLDLSSWKLLLEPSLQDTAIRRIYVDLPGHGLSDAGVIKSSADILAELQKLTLKLKLEDYAIAGHSYGGYLAEALAGEDEMVRALFLSAPVVYAKRAKRKLAVHQQIVVEDLAADTDFNSLNVMISWENYKLYQKLFSSAKFDKKFGEILDQNYRLYNEEALLERPSEVPTMILTGKYDNVVGFEDQFLLSKNAKNADFICFNNAGHNLQVDQTKKYLQIFKEWCEENVKK